jgi:NADH dehydrogenase
VVTLVEAGPRILPALPDRLAEAAQHELQALGVRVLTEMAVTEATADAIVTRSGDRIVADLKIWAAGVKGAILAGGVAGADR